MSQQISQIESVSSPAERISPQQWRSGIAAWLGWFFDGLDLHLYTLVSGAYVAQLMHTQSSAPEVVANKGYIQAAFLVGWALGGTVFGWLGDRVGRSRALALTILTYACFTGLSTLAQSWWHLLIFRFVAALGIGGEWAIGSALLSETWPKKWRVWIAAVLQTAVNLGILIACVTWWSMAWLADESKAVPGQGTGLERYLFLVGVLPAVIVHWIRKKVPEPEEWHAAKQKAGGRTPSVTALFKGSVLKITLPTIAVCVFSLTTWWAFVFWDLDYLKSLPAVKAMGVVECERLASTAFFLVIGVSIIGNYFSAWVAKLTGFRMGIIINFAGFLGEFIGCYSVAWDYQMLIFWMSLVGFFSGVFGLFTMYLPPLFPTLLRTTGAGFCYNIGRLAAAGGTILFGVVGMSVNFRTALLVDGFLLVPAIIATFFMPDLRDSSPDNT